MIRVGVAREASKSCYDTKNVIKIAVLNQNHVGADEISRHIEGLVADHNLLAIRRLQAFVQVDDEAEYGL